MKKIRTHFLLIIFATSLISCDKKDDKPEDFNDCIFIQNDDHLDGLIDDTEKALMLDCDNNPLNSKDEIKKNLIGEWKLIGFAAGWWPKTTQPCGYIIISEDELIFDFESASKDAITTHDWSLEQVNWTGGTYYRMEVNTTDTRKLAFNRFSRAHMYFNHTESDGDMYLYEKVR